MIFYSHIDKAWLKQVCFGMKTSPEHVSLIIKILEAAGYRDVKLAKMGRTNDHDFGFGVVDFTP